MGLILIILFIYIMETLRCSICKKKLEKHIKEFNTKLDLLKENYISYQEYEQLKNGYQPLYKQTKKYDFEFNNVYNNLESIINEYNELYIKKELEDNKEYFNNLFTYKIDNQQRRAIITDDNNSLVVAGAGSGKTTTMVGKAKYLIEKKNIKPEEILIISFTNNTVNDFKKKLNNDLVKCTTFHKLGLSILDKNEKKKDIADRKVLETITKTYLMKDIYNDKDKLKVLVDLCSLYLYVPMDINKHSLEDIKNQEKDYDLETLKNKHLNFNKNKLTLNYETVKSYEEYIIANYLYLNGIEYTYEKNYKYDISNDKYRRYRPDFYLEDYGIYIEHFGINKNGRAPQYSREKELYYIEEMKRKRQIHKYYGTTLIETYSYNAIDGTLFSRIDEQLKKHNVEYKPRDYKEIVEIIMRQDDKLNALVDLITKFIGIFKSNNYSPERIKKFINSANSEKNNRDILLLTLINDIYFIYQNKLKETKRIDFEDMINLATEKVEKGKYKEKISYIIIDEFQDICYSKYKLIKSLQDYNNCKITAVGDDWQSIYRFSGSNLDLFINFKDYFYHPKIMFIENTYRNSKELIKLSSDFIMENKKGQIKKNLHSNKSEPNPISIYSFYETDIINATKQAIEELKKSGCENIGILGRNNSDLTVYNSKVKELNKTYNVKIKLDTIHQSKGLEYDGVIICNMRNSINGFPNKMTDDPIFKYIKSNQDIFPYEEERRLFYVALTRTKSKCILLVSNRRPSIFIKEFKHINVKKIEYGLHKCKKCGCDLIIRESKKYNKAFYGCRRFPDCRYTENI